MKPPESPTVARSTNGPPSTPRPATTPASTSYHRERQLKPVRQGQHAWSEHNAAWNAPHGLGYRLACPWSVATVGYESRPGTGYKSIIGLIGNLDLDLDLDLDPTSLTLDSGTRSPPCLDVSAALSTVIVSPGTPSRSGTDYRVADDGRSSLYLVHMDLSP
ncbi:uncharacterized protein N7482_008791 [Penicillium canariense]|uniref:Uncharacterized protein n=1 Tax=Penicillium canariense TaxID=189055 RepID=A0A9W9LHV3_9EURO|nr:uncharacterized protein N7482_008791 [Penicillium canariense]KAJ5157691.1 hypothetical protein N7482_008791 [Penicillium canariense]